MSLARFPILLALLLSSTLAGAAANGPNREGRALYEAACRACHDPSNVMVSSPKAGDTLEWSRRLRDGIEKATDRAVNGIGAMPPKGGDLALTREQIRAAVLYMAAPSSATK